MYIILLHVYNYTHENFLLYSAIHVIIFDIAAKFHMLSGITSGQVNGNEKGSNEKGKVH